MRGVKITHSITLNVLGESPYTLTGTADVVSNGMMNLETGMGEFHDYSVWSFPGREGTFEGETHFVLTEGFTYMPLLHMVLQGRGVFEGQTLTLSYEGPLAGMVMTGFLLKR